MEIQCENTHGKSVHQFMNDWMVAMKVNEPEIYKTDIQVVNPDVKAVFKRSASLRKKRKITNVRSFQTKKNPRTRIFKDCHPIQVVDVNATEIAPLKSLVMQLTVGKTG